MQDDSTVESDSIVKNSPLLALDIDNLFKKLNDNSLESRLQICSLFSISNLSDQRHSTISYCIDTLIYLYENYSSDNQQQQILLTISTDYYFIPRSYNIIFDYILDIILQNLSPTLILLQIEQQRLSSTTTSIYPKNLLHTLSPTLLRYIYDQKLLGQLLKYIQTTTTNERRWIANNNNKRKLDDEDNKLTDEQFIEKIIQHVSNITQWTDEQQRYAIYTYIIEQRQTLLQSL
ncbi:unnamed protein product [Rotaria sp. Silwood1]|nr:unnamed protein product [Rotaria sp. Silwood1]